MQSHGIVEIEEGALSVVVGAREGARARVLRAHRVSLAELDGDRVAAALRGFGGDLLQGVSGVHVVLGDRRMQHFVSAVPLLSVGDTLGYVTREALRLTGSSQAGDVLVTTRLLRRLPGGRVQLATTALARSVWEPLAAAFAALQLPVLGLHSLENCLAFATQASFQDAVAVLECTAGRARFVLCRDQAPLQVRRFLVGGADGNASALTTQLNMELPRTLDWLRETGQPLPRWLVLGMRVPIDDDGLDLLLGDDLQQISRAAPAVDLTPGQVQPSLAAMTLLQQLALGQPPVSLLVPARLRLPWNARWLTATLAAAVVGSICSAMACIDGAAWWRARSEFARAVDQRAALEAALAATAAGADGGEDAATAGQGLYAALSQRRPVSRLIAAVSNCADADLRLDELRFASTERVVVGGTTAGKVRSDALAAVGRFSQALRKLPFVRADGAEEITEMPAAGQRLRFRITLSWRNE